MLAVAVTRHNLVRSMPKVNSDRLKQPLRLNGGSFFRSAAAAQFDD